MTGITQNQPQETTEDPEFSVTLKALRAGKEPPPPADPETPPVEQPPVDTPPAAATPPEQDPPPNDDNPSAPPEGNEPPPEQSDPPPSDPPPATDGQEPTDPPEDETQARRAEGRVAKANRELREKQAELKRVQDQIDEANRQAQQPPEPPPADPQPQNDGNPPDDSFSRDFSEYSDDIDARIAAQVQRAGVQTNNNGQVVTQEQLQQVRIELSNQAISQEFGANWFGEYVGSGEVDAFIQSADEFARPEMERIVSSGSAGEVIKLLSKVKAAISPSDPPPESAPPPRKVTPPAQRTAQQRSSRSVPPENVGPDMNDFSGTYKELENKRKQERDARFGPSKR